MDKLIFLDFDGVITTSQSTFERKEKYKNKKDIEYTYSAWQESIFDRNSIEILNSITDATNAKIIVSSSWRTIRTVKELQRLLKNVGVTGDVIDKTISLNHKIVTIPRGLEIKHWLGSNYNMYELPKKYNYVILDDDSDMLLEQKEHYFRCDYYSGLTPSIAHRVINFLNKY